ncbi:DUF2490 domain-containing protein [Cytophaga aurantiaca]|uniref:DUF2490 domain-containing protein n=1 Tax=Cytophaga aurantiaca TaxID=29530 RepID=UPI00036DD007|nr:DUF2490 domain-containing protein [Cytophaga aurantiaca]
MRSYIIYAFVFLLTVCAAHAQISPPGLGETNTASWLAFGVRQSLDSANKIQSFSYVGLGRISGPQSNNPLKYQEIFVLNQEFYHRFHKHWHYSLALSYRNQDEYGDEKSFNTISPMHKQEIRAYGRFMYELKVRNVKLVATYRQEFRSFFNPDFQPEDNRYQLRSRFRLQAAITLDKNKVHRFTASAEALFSSTQSTTPSTDWSTFAYKEARFCFYYSIDPKNSSFIYSIGYMNNLIGREDIKDVSYIALDVIWENPFKAFKREVLKPIE